VQGLNSRRHMHLPRAIARVIAVICIAILGVIGLVSPSQPSSSHGSLELLNSTMPSVTRWVCMGCHKPGIATSSSSASYFADYKSAACHYARSPACNKSHRGLRTVEIVSRASDRDAGGGGAAGVWAPPRRGPVPPPGTPF
jgi:hypothetical protein